jgi:membrane-bound lytic murein transglycosylase MltF
MRPPSSNPGYTTLLLARRVLGATAVLAVTTLLACSGPDEGERNRGLEGGGGMAGGGPQKSSGGGSDTEFAGESEEITNDILIERAREPFFGDLAELRRRRFLRVLVSYSKTSFFYDQGVARGFEVEMLREYEKFLNRDVSNYDRVRVFFIPTPFDRLLEGLEEGRGDLVAAGLTITPEREQRADFTEPYLPQVRELVVAHRGADAPATLADLGGREVLVRAGSSYAGHLRALSEELAASGGRPIEVIEANRRLVTEDLLEMVNAGVVDLTVADEHLAEAWAEILPDVDIRKDLAVHSGGSIAWAVRKECPQLVASLDAFIRQHKKGSLLGNILFKRYYAGSKWIRNPLAESERAKLEEKIALFQKYGEQYGFEWLALAAQAYQESGLDQGKRSPAGAVGVMQIKPSTAADKSVAVSDIHLLENNIHAGAKYLAFLRDRYFSDPEVEPTARVDFAWAAYNAGPARVRRLRQKAAERGFDPNRWFFNVEKIAAEEIGRETVDYVANINKYYLAYKLQYEAFQQRQSVRQALRKS